MKGEEHPPTLLMGYGTLYLFLKKMQIKHTSIQAKKERRSRYVAPFDWPL